MSKNQTKSKKEIRDAIGEAVVDTMMEVIDAHHSFKSDSPSKKAKKSSTKNGGENSTKKRKRVEKKGDDKKEDEVGIPSRKKKKTGAQSSAPVEIDDNVKTLNDDPPTPRVKDIVAQVSAEVEEDDESEDSSYVDEGSSESDLPSDSENGLSEEEDSDVKPSKTTKKVDKAPKETKSSGKKANGNGDVSSPKKEKKINGKKSNGDVSSPKQNKKKDQATKKAVESQSESESGSDDESASENEGSSSVAPCFRVSDEETYWLIESSSKEQKRIVFSEFKNQWLAHSRTYFRKAGEKEWRPGKGMSVSLKSVPKIIDAFTQMSKLIASKKK
jgi:hypothetical protein